MDHQLMQHQIVNSKVELLGTKENTTVKYSSNFRSADELKTAAEALMAEEGLVVKLFSLWITFWKSFKWKSSVKSCSAMDAI